MILVQEKIYAWDENGFRTTLGNLFVCKETEKLEDGRSVRFDTVHKKWFIYSVGEIEYKTPKPKKKKVKKTIRQKVKKLFH